MTQHRAREGALGDRRSCVVAAVRADPGGLDPRRCRSRSPATIARPASFFPSDVTFDNYETLFTSDTTSRARCVNSIGIAAIATLISIVLAAMAAYALARLDFPGKALILSGALAIAMFPPISIVGSLFDMWRAHRPVRHLARA